MKTCIRVFFALYEGKCTYIVLFSSIDCIQYLLYTLNNVVQQLSQRDVRWVGLQLGTSHTTIGTHGCLITAIASILNTTPDVVNERLKSVNGFKDGNLVIWAKINEAFPGIQTRREWTYNNDDVRQNLPAIVQVDGTPIGAPMHFVVFIGDQKLIDPWDGQIKSTGTYTPLSHAVMSGTWIREENYLAQLSQQIEATNQCQTQLKSAMDQNTVLQGKLEQVLLGLEELKKKLDHETKKNIDINEALKITAGENQDNGKAALEAEHLATEREDYMSAIADTLHIKYDTTREKEIVELILEEIAYINRQQQDATSPEIEQLHHIISQFEKMGINMFLQGRGIAPITIDSYDKDLVDKIGLYQKELAQELLTLSNRTPQETPVSSEVPQAFQSPSRSIRLPKPSVHFFSLVKQPVIMFLNLFLERKS